MYRCAECDLAVIVINDEIIKACQCDAPVIAEMSGQMSGVGGMSDNGSDQ